MPKDPTIRKVLVIGSGPIVIGQAAEFDYAGTQACKALREEGIEVVLVNSNPATIMTDDNMADKVYIQPLTLETLAWIINQEKPDGLLPTLGGQTGLNMAVELQEAGVLKEHNVRLLGTSLEAIEKAEDRELFRQHMLDIGEPIPRSAIIHTYEEAEAFAQEVGFPLIIRPAYTLGGTGGGFAHDWESLRATVKTGIQHSRIGQVLLEQSVAGWKEVEYEVMRDANDTCIIICNMENLDPVGVHTGDSIVVAPSQTLRDEEYHMLRTSAIKIIRSLKIEGGCNVQFALKPDSMDYIVIEVNPRVSRSSALASKAAGYPIAKVAAKVAIGLHLHEIPNAVTKKTKAAFEPALDYVVVKIPKWPFDKFAYADRRLGTQMKATGEVMAIDRSFESAFLKAVISLEGKHTGLRRNSLSKLHRHEIRHRLRTPDDERLFVLAEAIRREMDLEEIYEITKIDWWFLERIQSIIHIETRLQTEPLTAELLSQAEKMGFTDVEIEALSHEPHGVIDTLRRVHRMYPVYKMVDTCAAEFESSTPYFYSTYDQEDDAPAGFSSGSDKEKIVVIGSGPIRIGQGIEFDYCSVHAAWAIQDAGFESIIINNNPETVSTDFDTADKLYFEPLYIEDVMSVIRKETPKGVIVQFGGQTALNLGPKLLKRGVQILGTSVDSIDAAEDRKRFEALMRELGIPQPKGTAVTSLKEAIEAANNLAYPVLVRPSYVIGGRAMQVVYSEEELRAYVKEAVSLSDEHPILIDKYILGTEAEVDALCDGEDILIPGIMEHIERSGVHSGDSFTVYPHRTLSPSVVDKLVNYTRRIGQALQVKGLMNVQYVIQGEDVYVIEVNPRASRTVPILSKVTQVPMVKLAMQIILGQSIRKLGYGEGLVPHSGLVAVKAPVFSFQKLVNVDVALGPEMKSTGEVLGIGSCYEHALLKAFMGASIPFPKGGRVFVSLRHRDMDESTDALKQLVANGFELVTSPGTTVFCEAKGIPHQPFTWREIDTVLSDIQHGRIHMVYNTPTHEKDPKRFGFRIRAMAQQFKVPCFTALDTLNAYLLAWATRYDASTKLSFNTIAHYRQLPAIEPTCATLS